MKRAPQKDAGYSLVELVVALLLLGIIALAAESGLHFGARIWEHSQDRIGSAQQVTTAQHVLRDLLSHSLPREKGAYVTFSGEPSSLSFDVFPPQAFRTHGTTRARLDIVGSGAMSQLVLTLQSIAAPDIKKKTVLIDRVPGLKFAYLDSSDGLGTWLSYWRDRNRLPNAVRIHSDMPSRWPTLIVHPAIAQSATCALDPVSMTCRKN